MPPFAVDTGQLLGVVAVSVGAGVGVTVLYSLVILSGARAAEARRAGRRGAASVYVVLAVLALVLFLVGVVLGVRVMLTK